MLTMSAGTSVSNSIDSDWVRAHEELSRLAAKRAALDAEEGRWLLAALRAGVHVHLGFGSFSQYVERLFGYKPRSTQEKLRVAEALEELPGTAAVLESGALSWSAVRELTRVAVPHTEQSWLQVAQGKTVHELEALVAGKQRGATPSSAPSAEARRHVLRFDVTPETFCAFRDAVDKVRRDSGAALDDDTTLMLMARHVLGGPMDEGRASYQIALSMCPACGQGRQESCGELVAVGANIVAMAKCDGQQLGRGELDEPDARRAHGGARSDEADNDTKAVQVDEAHDAHVGVDAEGERHSHRAPRPATRAKQSVPPATRRAVLRRDHHRCRVPGCRNSRFVDIHHVQLGSEGGTNEASNLVTLCGVHHRAAHRGALLVSGSVSQGVSFRHADGSDYGEVPDPRMVEVSSRAFAALRHLGFRDGETRRVLSEVCSAASEQPASLERVLRQALAQLTSSDRYRCKWRTSSGSRCWRLP